MIAHALERVDGWTAGWRETGRLVLLLDFDGTLAPIVERPEAAAIPAPTRAALTALMGRDGVEAAVVSGRGLADVRERAALHGIAYAGNHGMEIEGPGIERIHPEALAARPLLEEAAARIAPALEGVPGSFLEDKGLTLSIHYRLSGPEAEPPVRAIVEAAVEGRPGLKATAGKMVLEVRPRVEWDKGRAALFLLDQMRPPPGAPVLYLGDDRTDEDAFRALAEGERGEGVVIGHPVAEDTAAGSWLRDPTEVGELFKALAGDVTAG